MMTEGMTGGIPNTGGCCEYAGTGRGDCEHSIGLPGKSVPGQHDGPDDTVDVYGKPNGWCWQCWKTHQICELEEINVELLLALRYARRFLKPEDHDIEFVDAKLARAEAWFNPTGKP